jgi:hypothetical protein
LATLRELITKVVFRTDKGGLRAVNNNVTEVKRKMRAARREAFLLKKQFQGLGRSFKGFIAVAATGAVAKFLTHDFAKSTDEAAKFSKATGVGLESYLGLTHAIKLSGGTVQDLQNGLMQAGKRARNASIGMKKAKEAFRELGISVKDSHGKLKNQDVILLEVADRFKEMKDGSAKTALAMELFGRAGAKLIPMFNEGSKGIKKMMAEAKKLGISLSLDQAKVAERYNDEMLRATQIIKGVRNQIALKLLPTITRNLKSFRDWATSGDNLQVMLRRLALAAKIAAVALAAVVTAKVGNAFMSLGGMIQKLIVWYHGLGKAALITYAKIFLIVVVLALVVLAIQDFYVWVTGGDSILGRWFGPPTKGVMTFVRVLVAMWNIAKTIFGYIIQGAVYVGGILKQVFTALKPVMVGIFAAVGDIVKALWPIILAVGSVVKQLFITIWPILKLIAKIWFTIHGAIAKIYLSVLPIFAKVFSVILKVFETKLKILGWAIRKIGVAFGWVAEFLKPLFQGIRWAWDASIGWIIKKVKWLWDKLMKLKGLIAETLGIGEPTKLEAGGLGKLPALAGKPGLVPAGPGSAQAMRGIKSDIKVGSLNVNVKGSADMSSPEMQAMIRKGAKLGLQDLVKTSFRNYQDQPK